MNDFIFKIPKDDKQRQEFANHIFEAEKLKKESKGFWDYNEKLRKRNKIGFFKWYFYLVYLVLYKIGIIKNPNKLL